MAIVIDSSVFCAFFNNRDVHHQQSVSLLKEILSQKYGRAFLTDYIFDETVSVALRRGDKNSALDAGRFLLHSEFLLAKIDPPLFEEAWAFFQKLDGFSFTDCTILAFMKAFDIAHVATFDKAFHAIDWAQVVDR